jgi:cytochrome oxidase Cu insertion factor (SCO1/SenC/PrrC family)
MVTKFLVALSFACGVLLAGAAWLLWPEPRDDLSAAAAMDALMWGREPVGGPFALIDHTGKVRTDTDFRGKLLLIYFGFTFCSDVCPTDLQAIASAMDSSGPPEMLSNHSSLRSIRRRTRRASWRATFP